MDAAELEDHLRKLLVERLFLDAAPGDIGAGDNLVDHFAVDSVRLFDLIVGLEDDFGVSFADDELKLANFDTLAKILERLQAKQAARTA